MICLLTSLSTSMAWGPPTTQSGTESDLTEGLRLLDAVHDHVTSFDDPAFYWFCRYVRGRAAPPEYAVGELDAPVDGRALIERPGEYRGRVVMVEGTLRAIRSYEVSNRPGVGTLQQAEVELTDGSICTVVLPVEASAVSIGNRVRAKGVFIKIRRYATKSGVQGDGPLMVAPNLSVLTPPIESSSPVSNLTDGRWIAGATAGAAVVWLILRRRSSRRVNRALGTMRHRGELRTDEDFQWLTQREKDG